MRIFEQRETLIDIETGTVLKESTNRFEPFPADKGYLFKAKNYFVKSLQDVKLSSFIKDKLDFMRIHLLAEYIYKDTNSLMIRVSTRKVRYMNIKDISKVIGLGEKRTRSFIIRMKKYEIMAERIDEVGEDKVVKYVLNPLFFNSNKYLHPDLYFLFEKSLNPYLPQWVRDKYHEIGNLAKENKDK